MPAGKRELYNFGSINHRGGGSLISKIAGLRSGEDSWFKKYEDVKELAADILSQTQVGIFASRRVSFADVTLVLNFS